MIVRAAFGLTHGLPGSSQDKPDNPYGAAVSGGAMVFRMDHLDSRGRTRAIDDVIHVSHEVVTDEEHSCSADDYKADHTSV